MCEPELQTVLRNWIDQAQSSLGNLPEDTSPAEWVAKQFTNWWQEQVEELLAVAHYASNVLREELKWLDHEGSHSHALHEVTHLQDALLDLSAALGLETQTPDPNP